MNLRLLDDELDAIALRYVRDDDSAEVNEVITALAKRSGQPFALLQANASIRSQEIRDRQKRKATRYG